MSTDFILTILGVSLLRTGVVVDNAGLALALVIVAIATAVTSISIAAEIELLGGERGG